MKEMLLELLVCPLCQHDDLVLTVHARDEREIREGELVCKSCQVRIPIQKGIVNALVNPPQQVVDEAKGWIELLDVPAKQHEFKDDWILALPFIRPEQTIEPDSVEIWHQVGKNFFESLDRFDWQDKRVLEIGAGRCWGVAELARRGAYAVGLDILAHKYLGLETADIWFDADESLYFERVLGDMHRMPFRPGAFDFVIASASLHHTDRLELALREADRVLDERGHALFVSEPIVLDGRSKPDLSNSPEVLHSIIESRPTFDEWRAAFEAAGFEARDAQFQSDMSISLQKCSQTNSTIHPTSGNLHRRSLARLRSQIARSYVKRWLLERIRRAPSAPKYYYGLISELIKRRLEPLIDRFITTKIAIDQKFTTDGEIVDDPITGQKSLVARKSSIPWYVLRGPNIKLSPGCYNVVFRIRLLSNSAPETPIAELQVTTLEGRRMHGYQNIYRMQFDSIGEYQAFPVPFTCNDSNLEFEFRVKAQGSAEFSIDTMPELDRYKPGSLKYAINRRKEQVIAKIRALFIRPRSEKDNDLLKLPLGTQGQTFYGKQYYKAVNPRIDGGYDDIENLRDNLRVLARILLEHFAPRRLLDVGCSMGFVVEALREQNIEAYGIDLSEYAIAHAPPSIKPYVKVGNVLDIDYPDESFDTVLCSEVLEHLPVDYVDQAIEELLRVTSGTLILTMPSIGPNEFGPPHGLCFPSVGLVDLVPPDKLDLDKDGRPWGGHITLASFKWWTEKLAEHGLVRMGELERKLNSAQLGHNLSIWNFYCCAKPQKQRCSG